MKISLQFPRGFDDHAWEVESKGWLQGVVAVIEARRYTLMVYDPARLAQDIQDALRDGKVFFEPNLVVVPSVTREAITTAVEEIVRTGSVVDLRADESSQ